MDFDIIIIGSGPGGYVAAIRAAQLGLKVACVEREQKFGGTCLNIGCIPSKALLYSSEKFYYCNNSLEEHGILMTKKPKLDLKKMMDRKVKIVNKLTLGIEFLFKKNKISNFYGIGSLIDSNTVFIKSDKQEKKISAKNIIIATGSKSTDISSIKINEKNILTSTGILSLKSVPKKMLVIGGGYIGLEMGSVWMRLGAKVTVIETLNEILSSMDKEITSHFMKSLEKQGIVFKLGHKVISASAGSTGVNVVIENLKDNNKIKEEFDVVLLSVGRIPNTHNLDLEKNGIEIDDKGFIKIDKNYRTNIKNIFAIGDVVPGPMLAHKAEEEAINCVEGIVGQKSSLNYNAIPSIIYTNPEVASVGKTQEQLEIEKIHYKIGKFPFSANGRALTTSTPEGFVKILADKKTDTLLGAHIIGYDAGNLISEIVTIIEFGGSSEDIARICHAHPTTSEATKEAAMSIDDRAIHI